LISRREQKISDVSGQSLTSGETMRWAIWRDRDTERWTNLIPIVHVDWYRIMLSPEISDQISFFLFRSHILCILRQCFEAFSHPIPSLSVEFNTVRYRVWRLSGSNCSPTPIGRPRDMTDTPRPMSLNFQGFMLFIPSISDGSRPDLWAPKRIVQPCLSQ
jgi:hypothetical protein